MQILTPKGSKIVKPKIRYYPWHQTLKAVYRPSLELLIHLQGGDFKFVTGTEELLASVIGNCVYVIRAIFADTGLESVIV